MQRGELTGGLGDLPVSDWLYLHTGLGWATLRVVEPRFCDARYYSVDHRISAWMIRSGGVELDAGHHQVAAHKGQWLFPGLKAGRQRFSQGTQLLSISFSAEWPDGKTLFDHQVPILFPAKSGPSLTRAAERLARLVGRVSGRDGFFHLDQSTATVESYFAIRMAFETWLSAYVGAMVQLGQSPSVMAQSDPRVLRAARLIDNHPPSLALLEGDIASAVGLSVSQLNRLFSRDLGSSPAKYRERRQFEKAIALLDRQGKSIKEVAFELGFSSLPHFSAWFRRQKGVSPRAYQNRAGGVLRNLQWVETESA